MNLTEVILDPTFGATEEFICTKVLLSVTLVLVSDVTVVKPWDKKHAQLQQSVTQNNLFCNDFKSITSIT